MRFVILCAMLGGCVEYKFSSLEDPGTGLGEDATDDEGPGGGTVVRSEDDSEIVPDGAFPDGPSTDEDGDGSGDGSGDDGSGDDGSGGDTGVTGDGSGGDTGTGGEIPDDACVIAAEIDGYLDGFQTEGDGRVLYCHSGSAKSYVFVDSDIDSCLAHLDHRGDVFPTTLCDS